MQARPVANPQASCSRRNGMALRPSTAWRRQQHHLGTPPPPHSLLPHQQHAPRRGSALVSAAMQSAAGTTSSLISQRSSRLGAPLPSQSRRSTRSSSSSPRTTTGRASRLLVRAERKEYYDFKDMPPLPLGVKRIYIPELDFVVVDKASEEQRLASLAIFHDIRADDQYGARLTRKSAITALCMYDQDDVTAAARAPGDYPVIDLLQRVYKEGLELTIALEEFGAAGGGAQ